MCVLHAELALYTFAMFIIGELIIKCVKCLCSHCNLVTLNIYSMGMKYPV